jgi:hypothetical protein
MMQDSFFGIRRMLDKRPGKGHERGATAQVQRSTPLRLSDLFVCNPHRHDFWSRLTRCVPERSDFKRLFVPESAKEIAFAASPMAERASGSQKKSTPRKK